MHSSQWKIVSASIAGTSHVAKNSECQDSFVWRTTECKDEVLVVIVSDGAGSAKRAKVGADTTCATMMQEIQTVVETDLGIHKITRKHVVEWLNLLRTQFQILAETEKLETGDFACTLLAAIIQGEKGIFLQIGDGGMVYTATEAPDEFHLVIEPQQGEYANTTNFVTDLTAADILRFEVLEKRIDEIAIFTDGLQRIALDYQTNTAHAPFFRPMLAPLRSEKVSPNLSEKLHDFLDSPKINERTDDDKTLILASRR
ncbi:MAG: PP2C family serine/threonine-protein phosphatase [Pyrinomonadaceae bacterium]